MEDNRALSYIHMFMCLLNFAAVLYIAGIMMNSVYRICGGMQAREFLDRIAMVPGKPGNMMVCAIGSYLLLVAVILLRRQFMNRSFLWRGISPLLEIVLCIGVMGFLNMGYSGVVLLVMADLVEDFKEKRSRVIFFLSMIILYIISDYDLISSKMALVPFETYLVYYNTNTQGFLMVMKSVLISINVMVFILYVVILIHGQMRENERISSLNEQLNQAYARLKDYALESEMMAETRERNRLAREIHDTLGHALTGIAAGIDACLAVIDISPETTKQQLNRISEVARQGLKDVRRSVNKLRPDALERLNLEDALTKLVDDITAVTKTEIVMEVRTERMKFSADEEDVIYRVVQESITNAIRHGHAGKVSVVISRQNQWLTVNITDNGVGCADPSPGFGLKHMQERLALLNGTVDYDGSDGFAVVAKLPIRWGEDYD